VVFTSSRIGGSVAPQAGDWGGIRLTGGAVLEMAFAEVSYAEFGVAFVDFQGTATVTSSAFRQNLLAGVYLKNAQKVTIQDSRFISNNIGLAMEGLSPNDALADIAVQGNTFSGNIVGVAVNTHAGRLCQTGGCVWGSASPGRPGTPPPREGLSSTSR
jgi:nitrous oxidase accessory protein NosD